MATKSVDNILYQCIKCQRHRVIKNGIDGNRCNYCDGYLNAVGFTNLSTSKDYKESTSIGKLRVDINCSDALTGLKAVQREAKKATAALKEFERVYNKTKSIADECNVSSQELLAILAKGRGDLS